MRVRPFRAIRAIRASIATLIAALATAAAPAAAQTSPRDDTGIRPMALAARYASMPVAAALEHGARDTIRATARDDASIALPVVTPYRSTPSTDVAPDGFTLRVPGTGLDLTNGSLTIRRNDARNARGVSFSMQLTY